MTIQAGGRAIRPVAMNRKAWAPPTAVTMSRQGCASAPAAALASAPGWVGAPVPAAYPQSALPPFVVPLKNGVPAVMAGGVDTATQALATAPGLPEQLSDTAGPPLAAVALQPAVDGSFPGHASRWMVGAIPARSREADQDLTAPGAGAWPGRAAPEPTMPGALSGVPQAPGTGGGPELPDMPTTPAWPVSEHTGVPESGPYLTPTGPDTTGEVTAAEVPEPAGLALVMLAGLAALAGLRLGRLRTAHHSR